MIQIDFRDVRTWGQGGGGAHAPIDFVRFNLLKQEGGGRLCPNITTCLPLPRFSDLGVNVSIPKVSQQVSTVPICSAGSVSS